MQTQDIHDVEDPWELAKRAGSGSQHARLTALLDAAAAVVDEIGFERLTTAMVAERAGASIGTVYRYFPDRIALLQALAARNMHRILARVSDEITDERHETWLTACAAAFDVLIEAYRTEPAFRGLRDGDVIDLRPAPHEYTFNSMIANRLLDNSCAFRRCRRPRRRFLFETTIEVSMPWRREPSHVTLRATRASSLLASA